MSPIDLVKLGWPWLNLQMMTETEKYPRVTKLPRRVKKMRKLTVVLSCNMERSVPKQEHVEHAKKEWLYLISQLKTQNLHFENYEQEEIEDGTSNPGAS